MITKRVEFNNFTVHKFLSFERGTALIKFYVENLSKIHSFTYLWTDLFIWTFLKYLF